MMEIEFEFTVQDFEKFITGWNYPLYPYSTFDASRFILFDYKPISRLQFNHQTTPTWTVGITVLIKGDVMVGKWQNKPPRRMKYPATELRRLQWRLREVEELPAGFRRSIVTSPQDMMAYWFLFKDLPHERFCVFCLNSRNEVTSVDIMTEGTLNASLVHPREAFRAAVGGLAAAIIVAHNHPSGSREPSTEDISVTRQLVEAGKIVGIPLHDHIIFADGQYTSFAERGLL
jgi:DNA repair protein RadC